MTPCSLFISEQAETQRGNKVKASEIIANAVAETVTKAMEAGMIRNEEDMQTAGRAAMNLMMTTQPELWAAYQEEIFEILQAAA